MKTIPEKSIDRVLLDKYCLLLNPGDTRTWEEISDKSTVGMDAAGKQKLRSALRAIKLEYLPVRGIGVQIVDPRTVVIHTQGKLIKVDNATRSATRSFKNNISRFEEDLTEEDQKHTRYIGSIFGAIQAYTSHIKSIRKNNSAKRLPITRLTSMAIRGLAEGG